MIDTLLIKYNDVPTYDYIKKEFKTDNIGVIAIFKKGDLNVCVANTHIYWDPSYPYIKTIQCHYLCENITKFLNEKNLDIPIIICGDFNSLPDSSAYELMLKGKSKLQNTELIHSLNLSSSFEKEPKFTNFTPDFKGTLDYIFYNSKLKVSKNLETTKEEEIKTIGLPNDFYPSDHISLYCEFNLFLNK